MLGSMLKIVISLHDYVIYREGTHRKELDLKKLLAENHVK